MLISTEAGAAEIVSAREDTRFYDDVGCLVADWRRSADAQSGPEAGSQSSPGSLSTPFVRLATGDWSDARTAWFAHPANARTAMASGLVAFATADEARGADRDGRALRWRDVLNGAGAPR